VSNSKTVERRTIEGPTKSQNDPINSLFKSNVTDLWGLSNLKSFSQRKDCGIIITLVKSVELEICLRQDDRKTY
jgi:hypothetical protein